MTAPSLRLRLLLASAASIVIALLAVGLLLSALFARHVEANLNDDLSAELIRLTALVDVAGPEPTLTQDMPDPRYALPYGDAYWQIDGGGEPLRSRSLWDTTIALPPPAGDGAIVTHQPAGPEGQRLVAQSRALSFETDASPRTLILTVARNRQLLDAAIAGFRFDLAIAMAVLAVVLIAAAWLQVALGLRPLDVIRSGVAAIRSGHTARLGGAYPTEVMPLVTEVNQLLDAQEQSIAFARARAADLAHGLKTNLAVLSAEADTLARAGHTASATSLATLSEDMHTLIDRQLQLARLRHRSRLDHYLTPVAPLVAKVAGALQRTPKGEALAWRLDIPAAASADVDGADLLELIGVVLDNAADWAREQLDMTARIEGDRLVLVIADDGPGVAAESLPALGERGHRLDQTHQGSGLGLAIAQEIASLNGGGLAFANAPAGGLVVTITLPAALAAAPQKP